jgi:hypothetical protein
MFFQNIFFISMLLFSNLPKTKEKAINPHADVLIAQDPKSFSFLPK